jgi:hypothetical protein
MHSIAAVDFIISVLDLNPQIERVSIAQDDSFAFTCLAIAPKTDAEVEREEAHYGYGVFRAGFGGDRHAHARLMEAWIKLMQHFQLHRQKRLCLYYNNRSKFYVLGSNTWSHTLTLPGSTPEQERAARENSE